MRDGESLIFETFFNIIILVASCYDYYRANARHRTNPSISKRT